MTKIALVCCKHVSMFHVGCIISVIDIVYKYVDCHRAGVAPCKSWMAVNMQQRRF